MKKIILCLTLFLTCKIFCQIDKPADHYSLVKGINVSHNLNSGSIGYFVPIYDIKIGNINLKSQLNYDSNGFKPGLQPGMSGLNWSINPIGKISRETTQNLSGSNYLLSLRNSATGGLSNENKQDCPVPADSSLKPGFKKKDLLTDITNAIDKIIITEKFYFDFFGYKGYFIIDNEKKPIINCETAKLTVSLENLGCQYLKKEIGFSQILIRDEMGNKFYFGGQYNTLDINYAQSEYTEDYVDNSGGMVNNSYQYTAKTRNNYIIGWNLSKIELSDGRQIIVNYIPQSQQILADFVKEGQKNPKNVVFNNEFPTKASLLADNLYIANARSSNSTSIGDLLTLSKEQYYTKIAAIDNISIDDIGSLFFTYNITSNPLEISNYYLKEINFKDLNNKTIDKYEFEIKDFGSTNKRTFLTSVKKNNIEKYIFNYQKTDNFPNYSAGTNAIGYMDQNGDLGLLKKVILPTTGEIEFEYEPNTSTFDYRGAFLHLVQNPLNDTGGARIKKQLFRTSKDAQPETTNYSYNLDYGSSSGIRENISLIDLADKKYNRYSNTVINYSEVTEDTGKGKIIYKFSDYVTNPDTVSVKTHNLSNNQEIDISKAYERGKLLKKSVYNQNNSLISVTDYKYTNFLKGLSDGILQYPDDNCTLCKIFDKNYYVYIGGSINNSTGEKKLRYSYVSVLPYVLSTETTTEYFSSGIILNNSNIVGFEFNKDYLYWHPHPVKTIRVNNGRTNISFSFYPGDLLKKSICYTSNCTFTNLDNPGKKMLTYKQMIDENVNYPILSISKNHSGKYSLVENIYTKFGISKYLLSSKRLSENNSLFTETNFENATVHTVSTNDLYDDKQNLIQSTPTSGIPTTIIYGYHQTLPIAVIKGATYAQVMQAFNLDPINPNSYLQLEIVNKSNTSTESELLNKLNDFKNKPELKSFFIETYIYEPLVGVKSIISSSGLTESYRYDNANRLDRILNIDDNIIKEYKYNYAPIKHYNEKYTKIFYKNNCPNWMVGQPYTYTVPANTYMSIISPEDATLMAQNDASINGQAEANANGSCGFISCDFTPNYYANVNYSSIQQTGPNHISMILTYSANPPSSMSYTSGGVSVGYIGSACRPSSIRYINSGNWRVTITQDGYVIVSANTGTPSPTSTVGFSVEYDK